MNAASAGSVGVEPVAQEPVAQESVAQESVAQEPVAQESVAREPVVAGAVAGPLWRRSRLWLVMAAVVLVGAVALSLTSSAPGRPLDPDSYSHRGSHALAQLLSDHGTTVHRTTSLDAIASGATVLLAFPDNYSAAQLNALAGNGRRLVLPASGFAVGVLAPGLVGADIDQTAVTLPPDCQDAGALAAGAVRFPAGTTVYTGANCYGGRVHLTTALVVLGPSTLLSNARLADAGVAALDLNAITADGTITDVTWLLPGADAQGQGSPSVWQLLPGWTPRAVVWLLVLGLLVMIWRARRMGPVVYEPLPVVVRAAEIVEGHGRLYRRAHARANAASALRQAALRRLARAEGLPATHTVATVVDAVSARSGVPGAQLAYLLDGPVPTNDAALQALARELRQLELAAPLRQGEPS